MANVKIHAGLRAFGLNLASREIAGLCEAQVNPVLRIGLTDNSGELSIRNASLPFERVHKRSFVCKISEKN